MEYSLCYSKKEGLEAELATTVVDVGQSSKKGLNLRKSGVADR